MASEILKNSIALLYRKKGNDILTRKELELMITMDFRWFTPKEAQALIELAKETELLIQQKNGLKINFDWRERTIPLEFKPTTAVFEAAAHRSCFSAILDVIDSKLKLPRAEIVAEINKKQHTLNVAIEVAALLVAAQHDLDISEFYDLVDDELKTRFGQKLE